MKRFILLFIVVQGLTLPLKANAQFTAYSFEFDGVQRDYYVHVPTSYNSSNPASVVVWLHGMGQISVQDVQNLQAANWFVRVSDTANFILLVPVALEDNLTSMRAWNSRAGMLGYYPNSDVDDIGFINALVDTAEANYSINPTRVYLCGFSMGGFMTERMALQSNDKFAAFASVSGTIGAGIQEANPNRAIPIAHFHGTADNNVKYVDNPYGIDPDSLIKFWIANNGCDTAPVAHNTYTDQGVNGSVTIDHYVYDNGQADVEFFKENNAQHEWLPKTCNKIWLFFRNYSHTPTGIISNSSSKKIQIYPNPTKGLLHIHIDGKNRLKYSCIVNLYDITGRKIYQTTTQKTDFVLPLKKQPINSGVYFLELTSPQLVFHHKVIVK